MLAPHRHDEDEEDRADQDGSRDDHSRTPPTHPVPRRNLTRTGTGVDERYCRTSMRSVFFATTLRPSVTWKVRR